MRRVWFHLDQPQQMTTPTVEAFYFSALRSPPEGTRAEPLLSIFTPAYKSGTKIQIPYDSLLQQTYQNWEWILYDDSPPEHTETWRQLSALRDRDYRIVPIKTDRNDAFIGSVKVRWFMWLVWWKLVTPAQQRTQQEQATTSRVAAAQSSHDLGSAGTSVCGCPRSHLGSIA